VLRSTLHGIPSADDSARAHQRRPGCGSVRRCEGARQEGPPLLGGRFRLAGDDQAFIARSVMCLEHASSVRPVLAVARSIPLTG
jgi:hypothetical protein